MLRRRLPRPVRIGREQPVYTAPEAIHALPSSIRKASARRADSGQNARGKRSSIGSAGRCRRNLQRVQPGGTGTIMRAKAAAISATATAAALLVAGAVAGCGVGVGMPPQPDKV